MALAQLFGGWTKWGLPRLSAGVFLVGFVPVLVCAGWVLLAGQPDANWFQRHIVNWTGDIGITGLVDDLAPVPGGARVRPRADLRLHIRHDRACCRADDACATAAANGGRTFRCRRDCGPRAGRGARPRSRPRAGRRLVPSAQGSGKSLKRAIQRTKMCDLAVSPRRRGAELLLAHTLVPPPRLPAVERLRAELGPELSKSLVAALVRHQRGDRRGRTSSSP